MAIPYLNNPVSLYKPKTHQTGFDPGAKTRWSGAEGAGINRIGDILRHGGYSPEQIRSMSAPGIAEIQQQAGIERKRVQGDAYSRGLGQSGVLSRSYGDVNRAATGAIGSLVGDITREGTRMVPGAISEARQGQEGLQQMKFENAQFNAQLRQAHEQLSAELSISGAELQNAVDKINATLYMNEQDRAVELKRIAMQYELGERELAQAMKIAEMKKVAADKDRRANLVANIVGGGLGAVGSVVGGFLLR
jgi:hypothetical protein